MNPKRALRAIADLVLPRACVVCGAGLMPSEDTICINCLGDLPLTHFENRSRNPMADRLNALIDGDPERYAYAAALFFYDDLSGYGNITRQLKYRRDFACGKHFARMLGQRLAASPLYADVDAVVPVPLHWTRKWKRGYNQAEIIAREVAAALGTSCSTGILRRRRRTGTQTLLSGEQKAKNVAGAFRAGYAGPLRHILLVDDVFTTGATTVECFKALRTVYGPQLRISVATLAVVE